MRKNIMKKISWPLQPLFICSIVVLVFLSFLSSASDGHEEDDPTDNLRALQCLAERNLNEKKYDEATNLAEFVVAKAFDGPTNWNRGNLLHNGFRILGMASLKQGNIEEAKGHLLNSAVTHNGSPQLDSFGPNMSLAQELLKLGRKEIVLEYFRLCKRFWDREELAQWTTEVENNKIPDFGPNLIYGIALPGSRVCPIVVPIRN